MKVIVTSIRHEADRIRSLLLASADGADLPRFDAGAYLEVGVEGLPGSPASRPYSIASDPHKSESYRIAVLREPDGKGGSEYLHSCVNEGSILEISEPRNEFILSPSAHHILLIAGGIGITPLLSMAYELKRDRRSFEIHYAGRSRASMAFLTEVMTLGGPGTHLYASDEGSRLAIDKLVAEPAVPEGRNWIALIGCGAWI